MLLIGPEKTTEKSKREIWEKPYAKELASMDSISFGKMKSIVKGLDRFCDKLLEENHIIHVENEMNLDLLDEFEDMYEEVGNVNIFLNNNINEMRLRKGGQNIFKESLAMIFLKEDKRISEMKEVIEEVEDRVQRLAKRAREKVLGKHGLIGLEIEREVGGGQFSWGLAKKQQSTESIVSDRLSTRNNLNKVIDVDEEDCMYEDLNEEMLSRSQDKCSKKELMISTPDEKSNELKNDSEENKNSETSDKLKISEVLFSEDNVVPRKGFSGKCDDSNDLDANSFMKKIISEESKQKLKVINDSGGLQESEKIEESLSGNELLEKNILTDFQLIAKEVEKKENFSGSKLDNSGNSSLSRESKSQEENAKEAKHQSFTSDSMDLDSDQGSMQDCPQETINFTEKGKKISMISLAKHTSQIQGLVKQMNMEPKMRSSMRQVYQGITPHLGLTQRGRRSDFSLVPLQREFKSMICTTFQKSKSTNIN